MKRRTRWVLLGAAALLVAGYAAAGFLLVPHLARSQIETFVAETLRRSIALGEIRFNPFTLEANVAGLRLTEADGAPLLAFRHLRVNAGIASLWRRGVVLEELELQAPDVELIVAADGSVNLARLAPPPGPAQEKPKGDDSPLRVHIGRLAVADGRLGFQDRARAKPFVAAVTPIRFSLTDFRTDVGHRNQYSFAGTTNAGERLEWAGSFTVQPLGSSGSFSLGDLRLATIDAYLDDKLPVKLASGTVQLRGSYQLELQPLSLEIALPSVSVRNLSIAERGAAAGAPAERAAAASAPVLVPEIDLENLAFSLSRRDIGVQRLAVRGARVDLAREADGGINLARLVKTAPASAPEPAATPSAPWAVHADVIALENGSVAFEDRTTSPAARMQLSPIDVTVNGWSTAPESRMKLGAKIGIDGKGLLGARGDVALAPPSATLAVDLQNFPLTALQPYIAQATAMTLHSGRLGAKGDLTFAGSASKVSGELRIDDLRTTDNLVRQDFVKWRSLAVTGIQFQQGPDRLRIERIVARQPYARVVIAEDGGVSVKQVLAPQKAAEAPAKAKPDKAAARLPIAIRSVEVVGGSANFADYSVQPSFATGIVELGGKVTGLSSDPKSRATVALAGKVDQYSPVDLTGEVNLLSADVYTNLALNFRNIELTTFNPYSGKFAGYNISRGKLSTEMKYLVEERKLDAKHHIVVDNLEFGDKTDSKDAAPIPIKLGVALLKDRRGVIELDLPVSGTLDDPEFRLAPLIWKAVVGLMTTIVSAPFKALGALFGGGEDLAYVEFQPGSAALTEAQTTKLGSLAASLVERPELRLNVPRTVATAADSQVVAKQALDSLIPPVDSAKPFDDVAKRKRLEAFETVYIARLKTKPVYPVVEKGAKDPDLDARIGFVQAALLDHLKPTPAALDALGQQRAAVVRDALLANKELNPERVFLVAQSKEATPATDSVRLEMKLE